LLLRLREGARAAWDGVIANRSRSGLTIAGMVVGVAAIIVVVSIVQSLSQSITSSFDSLGTNTLSVRAYTSFDEQLRGITRRLTLSDHRAILGRVDGVEQVTPVLLPFGAYGTRVAAGGKTGFTRVYGVTPNYQDTFKVYTAQGRFVNAADEQAARKICVIGTKVRENLDLPGSPIGQFLRIGGDWYKIVGVMEEKGDVFGISQDDYVAIPFSAGEIAVADPGKLDLSITLSVADPDAIEDVQHRIVQVLRENRKLRPGDEDDFKVDTAKQLTQSFDRITGAIAGVAVGLVGISLLVAGIGIMNMMLTSVTERTREIGICKALGAQRGDILLQFLLEAVLLSLFGGLLGVLVGCGIDLIIPILVPQLPAIPIPVSAAVGSVVFVTAIGVLFGVIPAAQAANLDPIEALRHE